MDPYVEWHDFPTKDGSYVVYVNDEYVQRFAARKMLSLSNGVWYYPGSDQKYRGHVYGGYGPFPAMELED